MSCVSVQAESSTSSTASGSNETTSASQAAQHDTSGISEALQDSVGTAQAEQVGEKHTACDLISSCGAQYKLLHP